MSNGAPRKWYQAPWFWITGGCCLGCLILPLGCIAIVGTGGFLALTNSPMVGDALDVAKRDATLIEELGEPIEQRFFAGNTSLSIDDREARLEITVGGPKGKAALSGDATRRGGVWNYHRLKARLEDGRVIDLLTGEVQPDDREYELLPLENGEEPDGEDEPAPPPGDASATATDAATDTGGTAPR